MIFVHSSFRTGSTFLWAQFRALAGVTAFYEVYHEFLGSCSRDAIENIIPGGALRHPEGEPYFGEFADMVAEAGGVTGFDPRFTMANAIPADGCRGQIPPDEARYINRLISFAESEHRTPVLTCTRSVGRMAGLKAAAPGLHLLLHRNLFRQWCSYSEQHHAGNPYFLRSTGDFLRATAHDPVIRAIGETYLTAEPSPYDPKTFLMFSLLHLHLYAQSAGIADGLISLEGLEHDRSHRDDLESLLAAHGAPVSLDGAHNTITYSLLEPGRSREMLAELREAAEPIIAAAPDDAGYKFAKNALEELAHEYECHEYHTAALRKVVLDERRLADQMKLYGRRDRLRRGRALLLRRLATFSAQVRLTNPLAVARRLGLLR